MQLNQSPHQTLVIQLPTNCERSSIKRQPSILFESENGIYSFQQLSSMNQDIDCYL